MGEKKAAIFKSPFLKGGSLNRLYRSTVISYPSRIESSQLSYGVRHPTLLEILFEDPLGPTLANERSYRFRLLFVISI